MTFTRLLGVLVMSAVAETWLSTPAIAMPQAPSVANPADEAEHEALRQLRALYEQAIRDNKIESLASFLHPDFHGVMITGRPVNGLEDLKRYWADIHALMGEGGQYTTTLKPELSILLGDVALARGTSDDVVVTSNGQEFRFTSLWTAALQKEDGRWKLRQAQGSMDPVENPFVREFTRRTLLLTGAVSGVVGLVLGAGITWFARRKRVASAA